MKYTLTKCAAVGVSILLCVALAVYTVIQTSGVRAKYYNKALSEYKSSEVSTSNQYCVRALKPESEPVKASVTDLRCKQISLVYTEDVTTVKTETSSGLKASSVKGYKIVFFDKQQKVAQKDGVTAISSDIPNGTKIFIDGLGIRFIESSDIKVPSGEVWVYSTSKKGTLQAKVAILAE